MSSVAGPHPLIDLARALGSRGARSSHRVVQPQSVVLAAGAMKERRPSILV